MTLRSLQESKGNLMNDKTRLGLYLLFPPFLLWFFIILLSVDRTLGEYLFQNISSQTVGILMVIAGMVFPGTALFTGVTGLVKKEDHKVNLTVTIMSVVLILMLIGYVLMPSP